MQDKILSNAQQGKESSILVLQMRDNNLSRQIGHVYGSRKAAVRIYLIQVGSAGNIGRERYQSHIQA